MAARDDERPEPELGEIEWLDGAAPDDRPRGPLPPWRGWYLLVVLAAVAVVVALTVGRHSSHRADPKPSAASTPSTTSPPPAPTPPPPDPTSSSPPVTVRTAGHPLLDVPAGWDLFAYGGQTVLRIQLGTGRITRTDSVVVGSSGPAFLVPGSHQLVVASWDPASGYLVPDGRPARKLPGVLARGGAAFPGPDPEHLWVSSNDANDPHTDLVGFDGRPTGVSVPVNAANSDGAGYLVTILSGGAYEVRPGSIERITTGALLAIGPTRWLTEECDDHHRCTRDIIDRDTGEHRVLGPTSDTNDPPGVISPDGSIAALVSSEPDGTRAALRLVDLNTGAERTTHVLANRDASYNGGALAWTPDSRWLLAVDALGRVVAVDRSGNSRPLTNGDPIVTQLVLRQQ